MKKNKINNKKDYDIIIKYRKNYYNEQKNMEKIGYNKNVKFLIKFTLTFFDFCIKIKLKLKILIRGENE